MSRGFSLVELILAVFLVAMIMAGLSSFQGGIGRDKGRLVQDITVQNQADYARKAILRELSEATLLQWPPAPGSENKYCNELAGWRNLRKSQHLSKAFSFIKCGNDCTTPCKATCYISGGETPCFPVGQNWFSLADGVNPKGTPDKLNFGDDVYYFRFCLTNEKQLYYYHGPGYLIPSGGCGSPGFAGGDHGTELLAGDPKKTVTVTPLEAALFIRPMKQENYLRTHFKVEHNGGKTLQAAFSEVDVGAELLQASQ